jgi:hypothetical protein
VYAALRVKKESKAHILACFSPIGVTYVLKKLATLSAIVKNPSPFALVSNEKHSTGYTGCSGVRVKLYVSRNKKINAIVALEALVFGLSAYCGAENVAVRAVTMMNSAQKT